MDKLGGTTYIPNPLRSPALMVLASTAEAARTSTSPGPMSEYHSIYSSSSGRYLDSEAVHRMAFSSSPYQHRPQFALYHGQPGEHYSERVPQEFSPHFLQLHPHLAGSLLHAKTSGPTASFNGTGAFRRIGPTHEHTFPFHHLQHQRGLLERERHLEESHYNTNSVSDGEVSTDRLSKERLSPHSPDRELEEIPNGVQQENCSPKSAASYENTGSRLKEVSTAIVKKEQVESGEGGCEESGNEQEAAVEKRRRRLSSGQPPCCPICGTSIRPGEMESHFAWEMERMNMNEDNKKGRRSQREAAAQARKNVQAQSSINKRMKQENNRLDVPTDDTPASTRHQTYLRVCANRMNRNGRSAINKSVRSRSSQSSPISRTPLSSIDGEQGPSGVKATICPVCEDPIRGNNEELNAHVETCLRKKNGCPVSVEDEEGGGDGGQVFVEYEWAGQTRIRATSLLEGGYTGSGFLATRKRKKDEDEDDLDLDIDGDDSKEYGKPQYSEADIIPCSSDEPGEEQARQALRGAVLSGENSPVSRNMPSRSRWSDDEEMKGDADETGETSKKRGKHSERSIPANRPDFPVSKPPKIGTSRFSAKNNPQPDCSDPNLVIMSLKGRLKELDKQQRTEKIKCLICMEPYTVPLVSIGCWHVHCEECWMRTLGAKKLCPQCNMITSPTELRRIFL